jgi:uncharacterized transporter YbjL
MAAAYATLDSAGSVPRATPMLNVLQRVGGSLGVAVLTVLLQNSITSNLGGVAGAGGDAASGGSLPDAVRERVADPLGAAFAHAYTWSLVGILVALVPALVLMREERRARAEAKAAGADQPAPAAAIAA